VARASLLHVVSAAWLSACSATPTSTNGSTTPPSPPRRETSVRGTVEGFQIAEAHAGLFAEERGGKTMLAAIVISDQPDVCGAAIAGDLNVDVFQVYDIRPSTLTLGWSLFPGGVVNAGGPTSDITSGPVPFGIVSMDGPDPEFPPPETGQFGFFMLSSTPAGCGPGDTFLKPEYIHVDLATAHISFHLDSYDGQGARGNFSIGLGDERLEGTFVAEHCRPPSGQPLPPRPEFRGCP